MKKISKLMLISLLFLSIIGLSGCSNSETTEDDNKKVIGIAIYSMGADSCVSLVNDAEEAAKKYGWEIKLLDANGDPSTQADQLATFISEDVDAIILNPTDTTSLIPSIKDAVDAGIPVCGVGMEMDQEAMDMLLFFAGIDDYNLAYSGTNWIVDKYNGTSSKAALITGTAGTDPTYKTIKAFEDSINGTDIVNVGNYDGNYDTATSMAIMEDLLVEHPDIKAVFCQDHVMAAGVAEAISDAGKSNDVSVVATVGITDYLSYVDEGLLTTATYVLLWKCGSFAIDTLASYFDGTVVPEAKYYADPIIITKENLSEASNAKFVFSPAK